MKKRINIRFPLVGVILLVAVTAAFSQKVVRSDEDFYHLKTGGSLNQNCITSFAQDTLGQMWFSTKDGVVRYNGKQFFVYQKGMGNNAIGDNFIPAVYKARNGELWIVSQKGASRYDVEKDVFVWPTNERLRKGEHTSMGQDEEGRFWFLDLEAQSLLVFDEQTGRVREIFYRPEAGEHILRFFPGNKNHLWVTTDANLFLDFDTGTGTFTPHEIIPPDEYDQYPKIKSFVNYILKDKQGKLWLGTNFGFLIKYDPRTGTKERYYFRKQFTEHKYYYIISLYEDREGQLWVGTWFDGLYKLSADRKTFTHYLPEKENSNSLSNNIITAIFQDNAGYLWFGTEFAGINILKKNKKFFTIAHNIPYSRALPALPFLCAVKDDQNKIWLGTDMGGLMWFYPGDYNHPHRFRFGAGGAQRIFTLMLDRDGNLWAGTEKGLYEIDPAAGKIMRHYAYQKDNYNGLSGKNIISLCQDKDGNIWAGSIYRGITKIDLSANKLIRFVHDKENPAGISNNYISTLLCDSRGNIWAGTLDGLNRFNRREGNFTVFKNKDSQADGINANRINCLYEKDGYLWIGTQSGGINRYDFVRKKFDHITTGEGLPSNNVKAINSRGNDLWFSTPHHLVKMNLKTGQKVIYGPSDGLQNTLYVRDYGKQDLEFFENFAYKDKDGNLYFGGIGGMYVFDPAKLPQNTYRPKVVIEKFSVNGKNLKPGKNRLRLNPDENQFDIGLTVLNFIQPEKNKIAWILEKYDTTWHQASAKNTVKYFNVPPGTYTFRYKGANNDGVWSRPGALSITVLPRFYQTFWFKILLAVFFLVLIISFIVYRQIVKRQLERKKAQLRYAHSNLSEDVIDEINTKLLQALEKDRHYLDSYLSLQKLAQIIDTKPNYLSQVINVKHGCSFRDLVNRYRIGAAKKLLLETRDKIETVAYDSGFNSLSTFNAAFKKETGMTPSQFRKKYAKGD